MYCMCTHIESCTMVCVLGMAMAVVKTRMMMPKSAFHLEKEGAVVRAAPQFGGNCGGAEMDFLAATCGGAGRV